MTLSGAQVVVTGGAGFIGSHLVEQLLAVGSSVTVIDDLSTGSPENLPHHPRLRLVTASVLDTDALAGALQGVAYVFHLATRNVRLSLRQPSVVHAVNVDGTYNVLKGAAACGARRLLYCSSSEVYGTATAVPLPEECEFRPQTIYGASKLAGEYYAQVFHRSRWLETVIARPHNAYGPRGHFAGDRGELIPRLIVRALGGLPPVIFGDGAQTRDFTYVGETAEYLMALMAHEPAAGGTFNICRGEEVTILDIAERVVRLAGLKAAPIFLPPRPHDVRRLLGDATRLRRTLGRSPQIGIAEGLERTIDWYRHHVKVTPALLAAMQPENWAEVPAEAWLAR
ncbi:MAG TPA: NAD-dependent epimerase/dehydratase family protein [Burkholderiales bacterium]|nr:NAD-dependent epimerase/dehydratase family protein [Burkholderiales bacterium]